MSGRFEREKERAQRGAAWLDSIVPPNVQRGIIAALVLGYLSRMGVNVGTLQGLIEANATKADTAIAASSNTVNIVREIRDAIRADAAADYEARRKSYTLSNTLARIEAKLDAIITVEVKP